MGKWIIVDDTENFIAKCSECGKIVDSRRLHYKPDDFLFCPKCKTKMKNTGGPTMDKLKPCPFCGGDAFMWRTNYRVFIECENFNANSHLVEVRATSEKEAVEAWNRRADDGERVE